jgi:hypothetical protein
MRCVVLQGADAFAVFGMSMPRLRGTDGSEHILAWDVAHDSLRMHDAARVGVKIRTAAFTARSGEELFVDVERVVSDASRFAADVVFDLLVQDARTGAVVCRSSFPVAGMPRERSTVLPVRLDIGHATGRDVVLSLGLRGNDPCASFIICDRLAPATGAEGVPETAASNGVSPRDEGRVEAADVVQVANHPNPFNPATVVTVQLHVGGPLRVTVVNLLGGTVRELCDETRAAGTHHFSFDGVGLPGGMYICRVETTSAHSSCRMHLIK